MYQSIPFYMALRPQKGGYGLFFNNTFKTVFDVGHTNPDFLSMEAEGGERGRGAFRDARGAISGRAAAACGAYRRAEWPARVVP